MAKITVWDEKRSEYVNIPEHWIDHPTLGKGFSKEKPKSKTVATAKAAETDNKAKGAK